MSEIENIRKERHNGACAAAFTIKYGDRAVKAQWKILRVCENRVRYKYRMTERIQKIASGTLEEITNLTWDLNDK